jgi:putative addiction module component (TIGR02574 family)
LDIQLLRQALRLDLDEQIELVEAIWDGILAQDVDIPLTEAQAAELDRRAAEHVANPEQALSWEEARASALATLGK